MANSTMEEFEALLNESLEMDTPDEGSVVKGKVIAIEAGQAIIDVGYKMEGRVDLKEFANPGEAPEITVGDEVEVFLRAAENARGEAVISREMARREEAWDRLEKAYADDARVEGAIFGRVKGGFTVDLGGAVAFLPGSQVDVRPVRDAGPLMGLKQPFQILKMDRRRGNIVVSRRAILEESRAEQRAEVIANLSEGQTVDGVVKNITEYGAFVDLGGVDGLLHVTDMAWRRVNHPSEILSIGETVKVQVIKINKETHRISLGMKQLQEDPWDLVAVKYPLASVHKGRVTNITDYGAFVDLGGVDGLLHVTDIAWQRISHPSEALQIGETVEVQVIRFNPETQRISLGMKQLQSDPWESVEGKFPIGSKLEGRVTNITDYGAFVELEAGVEGLVHVSEMSWTKKNVHPGKIVSTSQQVEVMVLDVDLGKRRISLGLKQCSGNPWEEYSTANPAGTEIEGEIRNITEFGLFVGLTEEIDGLVHLSDISWEATGEAALEGFNKGDMVKAKILDVDIDKERISLGIKQLTDDPYAGQMDSHRKGEVVTCTVTQLTDNGIEVSVGESLTGFIRRADLSRDRAEQRADRFAVGEKVDAVITNVDKKSRKLTLSIKARETAEEKQAVEEYGSSDSGASLGDILGAALAKRESDDDDS